MIFYQGLTSFERNCCFNWFVTLESQLAADLCSWGAFCKAWKCWGAFSWSAAVFASCQCDGMETQPVGWLIAPCRADLHGWVFFASSSLWSGWLWVTQLLMLTPGGGVFMARWDCGSQHLNEFKLLWIRTLKLWFCVHFQSALLLGEAALTPSTCFFFFGWVRSPVWLTAKTRSQVCQPDSV